MKPDWDKLMEAFKGHASALVADVDCTTEGKSLCEEVGVQGFPTIKFGDPADLEDYEGGRDFESLKKFADENLGPSCSPKNLDLCDDDQKAEIAKWQAKDQKELQKMVDDSTKAVADAESTFKTEVEKLQKKYEKLSKEKDEAVEAASTPELRVVKQVLAAKKSGSAKDEL